MYLIEIGLRYDNQHVMVDFMHVLQPILTYELVVCRLLCLLYILKSSNFTGIKEKN